MKQGKINDILAGSFGVAAVIALIIFAICVVPFVFIWSLNSLAELGGSSFYIEHGLFSYFVAFVFVVIIRGGKG